MFGTYPDGHLLIIHRWSNGPAEYARYVDHGRTAVSYVVNPRSEASVPAAAAAVVVVSDTADLGQARAAIAGPVGRYGPPQAVIALAEGDLSVAAALREEFGCPGRRAVDLHRFLDRLAMLDAARAAGVEVPPYRLVRSAVQLSRFAETAGWPLVVRPRNGRDPARARLVAGEADALDVDWPGPMLAQRHVALPVYHADGYYDGRDIAPWQLARYVNVPGSSTHEEHSAHEGHGSHEGHGAHEEKGAHEGHSAHGPLAFGSGEPVGEVVVDDPAQLAAVGEYLSTLIPRLSARPWIFHLEFCLGQRDARWHPVFLEVGCFPGGGEIPFSWREVYDIDLLRLEFALQRGFTPPPPRMSNGHRVAGSLLVPLPARPPVVITSSVSMTGTAGPYAEVIPAPGTAVTSGKAGHELAGGRFRFAGSSTREVTELILATARGYRVAGEPPARSRPAVVLIGGSSRMPGLAADLGLSVLAVHRQAALTDPAYRVCDEVAVADLLDEQAVTAAAAGLCERYPVRRVVTTAEEGLLPAARVNQQQALGGNPPEVVRRLKDKAELRRCLAERGLSPVRHQLVSSASELSRFVGRAGPAIVKPVAEGGSKGVRLIRHPAQADAAWQEILREGRKVMLAEEYLSGPEVSVEAFSVAGRHTIVAITDKRLGDRFVGTGHSMPAALTGQQHADAVAMTCAVLDAVGLTEGPSHTELKLTSSGPRVIESHNRTGGDRIPDLVRAVYGTDLERLTIGVPLGLLAWDGIAPGATGGAAVRFLTPQPGTVCAVTVPPPGAVPGATATVTVKPGDEIPPVRWSGDRIAGNVFATGGSALEAMERADALAAAITLATRPPVAA